MFYQYKIKYIKLQTFLIIPITLFIYYFLKLLKEGNNFSLNDCLCFTNNYLLTNKITSIEILGEKMDTGTKLYILEKSNNFRFINFFNIGIEVYGIIIWVRIKCRISIFRLYRDVFINQVISILIRSNIGSLERTALVKTSCKHLKELIILVINITI